MLQPYSVLEKVVKLGGLGLQAEDCLIRQAVGARGEYGGFSKLRLSERWHQVIIWRAILTVFDARLEEDKRTDLTVYDANLDKHHFELKHWTDQSQRGTGQIKGMQTAIDTKLKNKSNGYLLVTSINPRLETDKNFTFLEQNLDGLRWDARKCHRFMTETREGDETEFWIAAWPAAKIPAADTSGA